MKRIKKGFTLIELIIVLAIFSIILTLVMSFIDPVSKVMNKASIRERTAAYVDNIGEYLDKSLHYAEFMRVYNGNFCDEDDANTIVSEQEAVQQIVASCLNGAINDEGHPISGKVRVLKLINSTSGTYKQGQIYESIYNFMAGEVFETKDEHGNVTGTPINIPPIITSLQNDKAVINEEHFEDYSYFYNTGFYTLDSIKDPSAYISDSDPTKSFASQNKVYYSSLNPIMYDVDKDGSPDTPLTMNTINNENLCVNVVAFKNDQPDNMEIVTHNKSDGTSEKIPVFRSPSQLTATSMSLINVIGTHDINTPVYVRLKRKTDGSEDRKPDGSIQFVNQMTPECLPYEIFDIDASYDDGNIYIVYILPEEINDTDIVYN